MNQNKITKAIIPAAGFGTRFLPATKSIPKEMFPIIDKPTIQFIVEEAINSGITDILIVVSGYKNSIIDHFDSNYELEQRLVEKNKIKEVEMVRHIGNNVNIYFIRQKEPKGLGDAIMVAKSFVNNEPFAVLLGDDLVFNNKDELPALKQCIDAYYKYNASILGVQEVLQKDVSKYGIVKVKQNVEVNINKVSAVIEKPSIDEAPSRLAILGRYILTPTIFDYLKDLELDKNGEVELTNAIEKLISVEDVYACSFTGNRFDIGSKVGFVKATLYLASKNSDYSAELQEFIKTQLK